MSKCATITSQLAEAGLELLLDLAGKMQVAARVVQNPVQVRPEGQLVSRRRAAD